MIFRRARLQLLAVVFLCWGSLTQAQSVTLFVELNPMGSFEATTTAVKGKISNTKGKLTAKNIVLDLTKLESGIELRDKHMKEDYFQTKKFPRAVLVSGVGRNGKFLGVLMIRNQKRKISGTYKISGNKVEAEFTTKLSTFKIKKASYMNVGVEDEVKVKVTLPLG